MSDQQQSAQAELDEFSDVNDDFGPTDEATGDVENAEENVENGDVVVHKEKVSVPGPAPWTLGLFNLLSVIVIVAATVYGYIAATTGVYDPRALLHHFQGLEAGTLNILTMVGGGIAILALMGTLAFARSILPARRQAEDSEKLLGAIAHLDLEVEDGWMDEDLRLHAGVDRFLTATLGAYRLLQSRMTKYVSLEGELFRLEKSIAADQRIDLDDTYDHPGAARLAGTVQTLQDERQAARTEREELNSKLSQGGSEVCGNVTEAVRWNSGALDQLNIQTESLQRLARESAELSGDLKQTGMRQETEGVGQDVITHLREELASLPNTDSSLALSAATGTIKDLVARGGKLAIQSAMEIARLGDKAGQLANMSQELQNLITEFRAVATQMESLSGNQAKSSAVLTDTRRKLDTFNPGADMGQQFQTVGSKIEDLQRDIAQTAASLGKLSGEVDGQTGRLDVIGSSVAKLSGATWESIQPAADLSEEPAAESLDVDGFDPFGGGAEKAPEKPLSQADEAKQFAVSPFEVDGAAPSPDSTQSLDIESFASAPSQVETPAAAAEPGLVDLLNSVGRDRQADVEQTATPASEPAAAPVAVKEELPSATEKVYDLSEFDAVPINDSAEPDTDTSDRIYDLAEFGAVAVS